MILAATATAHDARLMRCGHEETLNGNSNVFPRCLVSFAFILFSSIVIDAPARITIRRTANGFQASILLTDRIRQ